MERCDIIKIAKKAILKRWDFDQLKYGDDMYGNEGFADNVWELVEECESTGWNEFIKKYPD